MTPRKLPTQADLQDHFDYNPISGIFVWKKVHYSNKNLLRCIAGTVRKTGYRFIGVPKFGQLGAHRLAWVYVYGLTIGGAEIDHIDGNPSNNAIANLRLATSSEQKQNRRVQSNNRCGLKGAFYHACRKGMKWRSQIMVRQNGVRRLIFLGYFKTAIEAHLAYAEAAREHFGEFARAS